MTTDPPPPRRKWHFNRWLIVLIVAMFGWSGWRAYAFRSALSRAKALGWRVLYTDPVETIRNDWKAAFKKGRWLDGVTDVRITTSEAFEQNVAIVHRLNPRALQIPYASSLRDLSALQGLTRLQMIQFYRCTGLTNVDAPKNLSALQTVALVDCTGITNVAGLGNLSSLHWLSLERCTGLTNVDSLKSLSTLYEVNLAGCTGLTNVDALKDLPVIQKVCLVGCTGLTNVDALKDISALEWIRLEGCTGLTKESVAALKAALPKTTITGP